MSAPHTMQRPALRIAHHHPGRLRVRAEPFVGDPRTADRVRAAVETIPGVQALAHDTRSGSILVHYDPSLVDVNGVISTIAATAGLDLHTRDRDYPIATDIIAAVRKLDELASETSGGRIGLGTIISGSLAALGFFSFVKGPHDRMPRWDSLVFWAYSVFIHAHVSPRRTPT